MVSVLFSGSSGAGSMEQWSGTLHVLCSWARHFTLAVPLSTRVLALFMQGVALAAMD